MADDGSINILVSTKQTIENGEDTTKQDDATTVAYLENITLQYFKAANERDWNNPILTQFLSPNIRSEIQVSGFKASGIAEHTELVKQTMASRKWKVRPICANAQLLDPSDLLTNDHLRTRRLGRDMGYACVWVLFQAKNVLQSIERESVGLFEYKRDMGGMWLMVHYTALSCTQPLPEACPWTWGNTHQVVALHYSSDTPRSALPELLSIFDNAARLAVYFKRPEDMASLKTQPLSNANTQFRLLSFASTDIEELVVCNLKTYERESMSGQYNAVSYVWGQEQERKVITVNGRPLDVGYNCWYALRQMMRLHSRVCHNMFWIDSICIDQDDSTEKSRQVALMGSIFANAYFVAACIGGSGMDQPLFETKSLPALAKGTLFHQWKLAIGDQLRFLCEREYFQRLWTVQECILAPRVRVFAGSYDCSWGHMTQLLENNTQLMHHSTPRNLISFVGDVKANAGARGMQKPLDLAQAILRFKRRECSDPRDRIFALLRLVPEVLLSRVPVDYEKSVLEVLRDYAGVYPELKLEIEPGRTRNRTLDRTSLSPSEAHRARLLSDTWSLSRKYAPSDNGLCGSFGTFFASLVELVRSFARHSNTDFLDDLQRNLSCPLVKSPQNLENNGRIKIDPSCTLANVHCIDLIGTDTIWTATSDAQSVAIDPSDFSDSDEDFEMPPDADHTNSTELNAAQTVLHEAEDAALLIDTSISKEPGIRLTVSKDSGEDQAVEVTARSPILTETLLAAIEDKRARLLCCGGKNRQVASTHFPAEPLATISRYLVPSATEHGDLLIILQTGVPSRPTYREADHQLRLICRPLAQDSSKLMIIGLALPIPDGTARVLRSLSSFMSDTWKCFRAIERSWERRRLVRMSCDRDQLLALAALKASGLEFLDLPALQYDVENGMRICIEEA